MLRMVFMFEMLTKFKRIWFCDVCQLHGIHISTSVKFYWNTAVRGHPCIVCGGCRAVTAALVSCERWPTKPEIRTLWPSEKFADPWSRIIQSNSPVILSHWGNNFLLNVLSFLRNLANLSIQGWRSSRLFPSLTLITRFRSFLIV